MNLSGSDGLLLVLAAASVAMTHPPSSTCNGDALSIKYASGYDNLFVSLVKMPTGRSQGQVESS